MEISIAANVITNSEGNTASTLSVPYTAPPTPTAIWVINIYQLEGEFTVTPFGSRKLLDYCDFVEFRITIEREDNLNEEVTIKIVGKDDPNPNKEVKIVEVKDGIEQDVESLKVKLTNEERVVLGLGQRGLIQISLEVDTDVSKVEVLYCGATYEMPATSTTRIAP